MSLHTYVIFWHLKNAHNIKGQANLEGKKKCYKFCEANVLEATEWKLAEKVKKLNVNKHLFCVKKGEILNIF